MNDIILNDILLVTLVGSLTPDNIRNAFSFSAENAYALNCRGKWATIICVSHDANLYSETVDVFEYMANILSFNNRVINTLVIDTMCPTIDAIVCRYNKERWKIPFKVFSTYEDALIECRRFL